LLSPVTEHTTAAFKVAAVASVIWRRPAEKVVDVTGALTVAFVQVAVGVPVNVGKPSPPASSRLRSPLPLL